MAPSALAFGVLAVCTRSLASSHFITGVRVWCVVCAVSLASWRLLTGLRFRFSVCAVILVSWRLSQVRAPAVFGVRCLWPLAACAPVAAGSVLCVQCPCYFGACSPHVCAWHVFCAVTVAARRLFTGVRAGHGLCAVFVATWCSFPAQCARFFV